MGLKVRGKACPLVTELQEEGDDLVLCSLKEEHHGEPSALLEHDKPHQAYLSHLLELTLFRGRVG